MAIHSYECKCGEQKEISLKPTEDVPTDLPCPNPKCKKPLMVKVWKASTFKIDSWLGGDDSKKMPTLNGKRNIF